MRAHTAVPAALVVLACGAPAAPPAAPGALSIVWPVPQGWKAETIPFPLDFAPDLPYRGVEEIRFAPHFFDPQSETYFSYSFAWVFDGLSPMAPERLAADLRSYFFGLARAVGAEKHATYDASSFDARVEAPLPGRFRGVVTTIDAFGDGRALTLHMEAESLRCRDHPVLLVTLSPQPTGHPVWAELVEQRHAFRCGTVR